ncbi:MAG TPA: TrkH family potassium uptake protein [Candidatus Paceibacterota bacterium]|nr:TrkH family potassium uptake protein [Verrucomicrobiota bacterium]HRZ44147.1 TrkH family potassium uptake protein [Candidatus Paceibacterota bacterium]HRZ91307.1 TrkH family potassium uptake protein [Candidatus Paceibacterota bacterium]
MNYRLLSKLIGLQLWLLGLTQLVCLAFAWWDAKGHPASGAVDALSISVGIAAGIGTLLLILGRGSGAEILRKEAIAVVGLSWLICSAFGALPYLLCPPRLGPVEAWFESMSGFTTTGATAIADLNQWPRAILLWRALTQWLGGLGILVLFVALLSSLGVGSKALFQHESTARTGAGSVQERIQDLALRLWQIYFGLSIICILGLILLGMSPFESACHAMAAVSTGGFSPRNESIAAYHSLPIELWISLFMLLGGGSFLLYAWLIEGRWERWRMEEETKVYLAIVAIAAAVIAVDLWIVEGHHTVGSAAREAFFQVASILTTTGFTTADFDRWPTLSRLLLLLVMAVGGCAGSTAGGIKVSRLIFFFRTIGQEIVHAYRPNRVFVLRLNGQVVDEPVKLQTLLLVALAGLTVVLGTLCVALFEPELGMDSCLSATIASLFNVGPGLGAVGPTQNFGHLGAGTLAILSLLMLLGRLEFFAVLVLAAPALWRKY